MKLEHAEIYRGGASTSYLQKENTLVDYKSNIEKRALDFTFQVNAAGGGKTEIIFRLGIDDFPFILNSINRLQGLELTRLKQRIFDLEVKFEALGKKDITNSGGSGIP